MQAVLAVAQDIVRAAADDDAVARLRQLLDHLRLDDVDLIVHGQIFHGVLLGRRPVEQQAAAGVGVLAVFLDEILREATALGDLLDQLAVKKVVAQTTRDLLADGSAAAAEFTADGDDTFHRKSLLFCCENSLIL